MYTIRSWDQCKFNGHHIYDRFLDRRLVTALPTHVHTRLYRRLRRKNDVCLMNVTIEMDLIPTQLDQLNCIQKWFNVKYLSKLCNEEGTMIRPGILNGSHMQQRYLRYQWSQANKNEHI